MSISLKDNPFTLVFLNVLGQTLENVSIPLWIGSIPGCSDPFVVFQITTLWYVTMFFLTSTVAIWYQKGRFITWADFNIYDLNDHIWIFSVGFFDALNGALVVPASPAERTPPVITALLSSLSLAFMVPIKYKYLDWYASEEEKKEFHYKAPNTQSENFYLCVLFSVLTVYMVLYPKIAQGDGINADVYWWLIFWIGMIAGSFYNVQQGRFFKKHHYNKFLQYVIYLTWETFYLMICAWAFTFLNLIPFYGQNSIADFQCAYYDTFKGSFTTAFGWNLMFNIGYYIAFIASCYINKHDALVGTASQLITSALVIIICYPINQLTPDRSVVMIGLLPITFILGAMVNVTYYKWTTEEEENNKNIDDHHAIAPSPGEYLKENLLKSFA